MMMPTKKTKRIVKVKASEKFKLVDRFTYIVAVVEPVITLPQAYQIFSGRSAEGVSILTWVWYVLFTVIWLWYGIAHKDKIITLYSFLYAVTQLAVIVGAFTYGGKWI